MNQSLELIRKYCYKKTFHLRLYLVFLALILITSPYTLHYTDSFPVTSNLICGSLLIVLSALSLQFVFFFRLSAIIGLWVIFLSSTPNHATVIFANDSFLGLCVICLACLFPKRPSDLEVGPTLPEGFLYNPSAENRRNLMFTFSALTWLTTRYFVALTFNTPNPTVDGKAYMQALLLTTSSLLVALSLSGSKWRWHTHPMTVLWTTAVLISTLLLVFISVIMQYISVSHWGCLSLTLSLASVLVFNVDELRATLKHLNIPSTIEKRSKIQQLIYGSEYYKESVLWEECGSCSLAKACKQLFAGVSCSPCLLLLIVTTVCLAQINRLTPFTARYAFFINITSWLIILLSTLACSCSINYLLWGSLLCAILVLFSPLFFFIPIEAPSFFISIGFGSILVSLSLIAIYYRKRSSY